MCANDVESVDSYMVELLDLRDKLKFYLNKDLLEQLIDLAETIDHSYVNSYSLIKQNSPYGSKCGYAIKARDLFMKLQEKQIREHISKIYKQFIVKENI